MVFIDVPLKIDRLVRLSEYSTLDNYSQPTGVYEKFLDGINMRIGKTQRIIFLCCVTDESIPFLIIFVQPSVPGAKP